MICKNVITLGTARWLAGHVDLFAVDSEVISGLSYVTDGDYFAVMRGMECRICKMNDADDMIYACTYPELADEMALILEDMRAGKRGKLHG